MAHRLKTTEGKKGFHAQTLEIFDAPLLPSAWPERVALPPRTFPKRRVFGNVVEPPSRRTRGCGPSDDACQTSFSGKLAEMVCPRAKIHSAKPESTGFKNFEGLSVEPQEALPPAQADARTGFRDHQIGARFPSVPAARTGECARRMEPCDHGVESEADVRARGGELRGCRGIVLGKSIPLLAFVGRSGRNPCWQSGSGAGNHAGALRSGDFGLGGRNCPKTHSDRLLARKIITQSNAVDKIG
jgi:hypothetical protein